MDAKTLYWTAAWINMAVVVGLATLGVRQVPRARYETHRRLMLSSAGLVVLFVASYVFKLYFLGREALDTWEQSYVWVLRFHELCVLSMVVGGSIALRQAHRLALPLGGERASSLPKEELARGVRLHRRAGAVALASAALGVLTAAYVLQGMFARA